jgi:hypothetical protein
MRYAWVITLLLITGCGSTSPQPQNVDPTAPPLISCTDPRPEVCTMQYAPVCGELAAGGRREYASACNACSDPAVTGYLIGSCPQ